MLLLPTSRELVISAHAPRFRASAQTESISLLNGTQAASSAQEILTDRDYPPFDRSIRDGYAVRAADTHPGATLRCIGELKAGDTPSTCGRARHLHPDHDRRRAPRRRRCHHDRAHAAPAIPSRSTAPSSPAACRPARQRTIGRQDRSHKGTRLGFAQLPPPRKSAPLNTCLPQARVAILSTGDEVVDSLPLPAHSRSATATPFRSLRKSRGFTLNRSFSAMPRTLTDDLRAKITTGLQADALILSGGVSAGKYDLVEPVLKEFGAETVFDAVAIRPGKPVVFAALPRQARLRPPRQSRLHHGHLRPFRSPGHRNPFRGRASARSHLLEATLTERSGKARPHPFSPRRPRIRRAIQRCQQPLRLARLR